MDIQRVYIAKTSLKVQGKNREMIPIGVGEEIPGAGEWSQSVINSYINGGFMEEVRTAVTQKKDLKTSSSKEAPKAEAAPKFEPKAEAAVSVKADTPAKTKGKRRGRPKGSSKKAAANS